MGSYPRVRLLREGLYYVVVLGFIVGGAVLRQVNLLLIIAGLLAAPLLLDWRFAMRALRGFSLRRRAPDRVEAGVPFTVDLIARKPGGRYDSWAVLLSDQIEHLGTKEKTTIDVLAARVTRDVSSRATYNCTLHHRGRYRFGPLQASNRFPLGLIEAYQIFDDTTSLLVIPQLGTLTTDWKRTVENDQRGARRSQKSRSGTSGDFYGMREYRSGDSLRWIHWRTSARLGKLAIRQFEQQRNLDFAIVLDLWVPDEASEDDLLRAERAVCFAATVARSWQGRTGSRLTIALSGSQAEYFSASAGAQFVADMLEQLAVMEAGSADSTAELLGKCLEISSGDARIVVLSTRQRPEDEQLLGDAVSGHHRLVHSRDRVQWIRVDSEEGLEMFELN
ncbi:MAG: DUF58 domain-containing protein [bacterium]|nr:DUF58 domain-containing protein [bacterium]